MRAMGYSIHKIFGFQNFFFVLPKIIFIYLRLSQNEVLLRPAVVHSKRFRSILLNF